MLAFHWFDSGNCRAYYRARYKNRPGYALYCLQDETSWGRPSFKLYRCSQDGEPDYEIHKMDGVEPFSDMAAEYKRRETEYRTNG